MPFFCFLSFCFSPCDPAIRCYRMMCIVRFPRSTIAAVVVVVVAVAVVVDVVGFVTAVRQGTSVNKDMLLLLLLVVPHSNTIQPQQVTSKKHPTLLPLIQDQPHQRASDMRHKTTHICVHSALLVQSTLKKIAVCDCPSTKQEARQCAETKTKNKN